MRVLGIDYGERRIGIAVTDPTGTIASPYDTLQRRRGKRPPVARVAEVGRSLEVEKLVVGLPLDLNGRETEWCAEVRVFGDALARNLGVPVAYVDERMTSVQAERAVRAVGLRKAERQRKGRVDAAAAALILQAWLDRR